MAEEDVGGLERSHREVDILGLQDVRVSRPAPRVADVIEGDFYGVRCRRSPFPEAVGRLAETFRRDVPRGLVGRL